MTKKRVKVKVAQVMDKARKCLDDETNVSSTFKDTFSELLDLVVILSNKLGVNSANSSTPPSQDPNRPKRLGKAKRRKRKPGGQKGHKGSYLAQVKNPTTVEEIGIDQSTLPPGRYRSGGFEARQVFDIEVSLTVTEYRAEVLVNEHDEEFVADFPKGVTEPAQYGSTIKAHSASATLAGGPTIRLDDEIELSDCKGRVRVNQGPSGELHFEFSDVLHCSRVDIWVSNKYFSGADFDLVSPSDPYGARRGTVDVPVSVLKSAKDNFVEVWVHAHNSWKADDTFMVPVSQDRY